jgi:hypothetical protein
MVDEKRDEEESKDRGKANRNEKQSAERKREFKEGQVREAKRHPAPESQLQPTNDKDKPVLDKGSDQKHR